MTSTTAVPGSGAHAATRPAEHLLGWDHLELWVGNARTTAAFFLSTLGFTCTGYAGPETGRRDRVSYVLEQGSVRLVVTGALDPDSPIAEHVRRHGDGVRVLAWEVDDAHAAFDAAVRAGAPARRAPAMARDGDGWLVEASVGLYGDTELAFVDRRAWPTALFAPGFTTEGLPPDPVGPEVGVVRVDHVVGNVEGGRLATWVEFCEQVLGLSQLRSFDERQISTEYSALRSTVMWDRRTVTMPINEPAQGRRKSQIQEHLEAYRGPGVQHLALATQDIVATVEALRARGLRFLEVPDTYYAEARERVGDVDLPWDDLARLHVLVDRDGSGLLLQIFSETITDRPTVFLELIERRGARGFGEGNFKALFTAIERDQARRGNL